MEEMEELYAEGVAATAAPGHTSMVREGVAKR
jgi:hypothetical protein